MIQILSLCILFAQEKVDFAREIQPVFEKSCYGCHGQFAWHAQLSVSALSSAV